MKSLFQALFALVVAMLILIDHQAFAGPGVIYSAPPPLICAVRGDNVTLSCYLFREGYWRVNGTLLQNDNTDLGLEIDPGYIYMPGLSSFIHQNMSITLTAMYDTTFKCIATGTTTNQHDSATTELLVLNSPPNPPANLIITAITLSTIQLSWSPPVSTECNHTFNYTVRMTNRSDSSVHLYTLSASENTFDVPNPNGINENCHNLDFHIWATNDFGESNVSSLLSQDVPAGCSSPVVEITVKIPDLPPGLQNVTYFCSVYDENRNMASQSRAEMGDNGEEVICTVTANDRKIFVSVNYTGAFIETTADNLQLIIVGGSLGVVIVVGAVILVLVAASCICLTKKKANYGGEKSNSSTAADMETGKQKHKEKPTSLRPMVSNPIYEGPTYDSPLGDPHKPLISRQLSTPDSPRYFTTPPALPPPRKASVSQLPILTASMKKPEEDVDVEMIQAGISGIANEEYTTMQPIAPVVPQSSGEVTRLGGPQEDEYVTIKT